MKRYLCLVVAAPMAIGSIVAAQSPSPSPSPADDVRCLAMLVQVAEGIQESVNSGDLATVHFQDMYLYSAVGQLLQQAAGKAELQLALRTVGRAVADLHAAADAFNREESKVRLVPALAAFDKVFAAFDKATVAAARALADQFTCPMHPEVLGKRDAACGKCGMALDTRAKVRAQPGAGTGVLPRVVDAKVRTETPLALGQPVKGTLRLTSFGQPLKLVELREVHTKKIHLLVVDYSLTDYHHEHPVESEVPGEYKFGFTPRVPGHYRVWADVQPLATGFQEYARTDIPSPQGAGGVVVKTYPTVGEVEGVKYELFVDGKVTAGRPASARVRVTTNGKPFVALEPLMDAFAHLVGFHEDLNTILHMHPIESKKLRPEDRGGPDLQFQIYTDTPGYYRLFLQVQIGGASKFVPFGIDVAPAS